MRMISFVTAGVLALAATNARAQSDPAGSPSSGDVTTGPSSPTGTPGNPSVLKGDTAGTPSAEQPAEDKDWPRSVSPAPAPVRVDTAPSVATEPMAAPMAAPAPVEPLPAENERRSGIFRPMNLGAALLVGGGVEDFTNSGLKTMTGTGGTWTARAVTGTRQYIGLEAAYVGAARSINALGLSSDAALVSNGVEGALRVNVPLIRGRQLLEPFGFVGVGWQHYTVTNTNTNTSDVADSDDVVSLPYGGGLAYQYGMLMADARFTYRYTYQNDLMRATGGRLNNWGLAGQLGVAF